MTLKLTAFFVAYTLLGWYADQLRAQKITACAGVADDQFVRNSVSCNAYYSCWEQQAEESYCPGGFLFEPLTQTCDLETKVDCTQCSPFGVQNLEDPTDRHMYYKCVTGIRMHRSCGEGLAFDARIGDCNLEGSVPVKQPNSPTLTIAPWQKLGHGYNQAAPWEQQQSLGNQNPPPWQTQQQQQLQQPEQQNYNSIPWQQQQQQQQKQQQNTNLPPWMQQQQPWQQQQQQPPPNMTPWQQQPQQQQQQQQPTPNMTPWQQPQQQQQQQQYPQNSNNPPWQQQQQQQQQTNPNASPWQNQQQQQQQQQNNNPWGQQQQQHQQLPEPLPEVLACEVPTGFSPIEGSVTRYNYCLNGEVKWEMRCEIGSYFSRSDRRCVQD